MLTSSSNVLTVVFKSDSSFNDEGFQIAYTSINGSSSKLTEEAVATCRFRLRYDLPLFFQPAAENFSQNGELLNHRIIRTRIRMALHAPGLFT